MKWGVRVYRCGWWIIGDVYPYVGVSVIDVDGGSERCLVLNSVDYGSYAG